MINSIYTDIDALITLELLTSTPNMVNHHFKYKKLKASTPAQVQNGKQKITYNHDDLVQIKEDMVKDK